METISQNWIWILLALGGVAYFMFRGGHGGLGSLGGGHGGHGGLGGFGLGGHGHGGHGGHERDDGSNASQQQPAAVIDPVSGAAVRSADAVTSVYQGRVFYFASKENRDRFETSPEEFAAKAVGGGANPENKTPRSHRGGHGC